MALNGGLLIALFVLTDFPRCSWMRTVNWRLVLPMYIALQQWHVYLYTTDDCSDCGTTSLKRKKLLIVRPGLKITRGDN